MAKVAQYAAIAISIAAAIPTGGGSTLLAGALGVSASTAGTIAAGFTVATSLATSLLAKKPSGGGSQTSWSADPNANIPLVFGRTGVGGNVVYRKGSGDADKNKYETVTTALSLGPIDAYETLLCDRKAVSFSGANASTSPYSNRLWMVKQLGACPEAAALNTGVGTKPGWTSAHKLSGLAADQVTMLYDAKGKNTFTTEPQMLRIIRGLLCYDPREDSTYPGGSGLQRANDQSTWAFTKNPYIQGLTFALGWYQNGKRRGGAGQPIDTIDVGSFVECANIADLNGWTSGGGQYTTGDDKWEVLKAILQAGGGEPIRDGAMLSCIIQAPRVSIATIGAGDLIGKASVPRSRPRKDRLNGVVPKYRTEQNNWEQVSGTVARITDFVTADGGERTKEIEYPLVQVESGGTADQPTQLAGYDVEASREWMPITLLLKLRWIGCRTGDCIDCGADDLGLAEKLLVIVKRSLDPSTGAVTLTARTEDPGKHDRVFALTGDLPPTTTFNRPDYPGDIALGEQDVSTVIANSFPIGLTITASDDGSVVISDHTRRYTDGWPDVAVTGATIASGGAAGDFFAIGYDDPDRLGGAVTYQLFSDDIDARVSPDHPGRHYVGYFTVPTAGSPPSSGGGATPPGGACVTTDTPIMMADGSTKPAGEIAVGDLIRTRHEARLTAPGGGWGVYPVEAVAIVPDQPLYSTTIGGKALRGTEDHQVYVEGGWMRLGDIGAAAGSGDVVKMTVTGAHTYVSNGILSHNLKQNEPV
jgi:hypothetical protein